MRNLYFLLTLTVVFIIFLLAFTFIFLEKEKHKSFFYTFDREGKVTSYIRVDRYKTEDKIIYRSTSFYPKEPSGKITHEKFVFGKADFRMEKFIREHKHYGSTTEYAYVNNEDADTIGFLDKLHSKFVRLTSYARANDLLFFDDGSIVTYMPLIDRYVFARGGAQSYSAVYQPDSLLPPARVRIIITVEKEEYITAEGKKTKTVCLNIKAKSLPECYVWVSKNDKSIVRLNVPSRAVLISKVAPFRKINEERQKIPQSFDTFDVIFPSDDLVLAGTVSMPRKDGKLPGVLLVGEDWPYAREKEALYSGIIGHLAQQGYAVLGFSKRGLGKSQGANMESSLQNEITDIESALYFLQNHERIDKERVFVVAHGKICSYIPRADLAGLSVKGLVMVGATRAMPILDYECDYVRERIKITTDMDKTYPEILALSQKQTLDPVINTKKDYAFILGTRVYLKKMRELMELNPREEFKKLTVPLLVICGNNDKFGSLEYVRDMEKALSESGLPQFSTVYFRGLNHYFVEKNYSISEEVLETIGDWINKRREDLDRKPAETAVLVEGEMKPEDKKIETEEVKNE